MVPASSGPVLLPIVVRNLSDAHQSGCAMARWASSVSDARYVVICEAEEGVMAVAIATDDNKADGHIGGIGSRSVTGSVHYYEPGRIRKQTGRV